MKKILGVFLLCSLVACEEIIYEEDISKSSISLLAPTNGVNVTEGAIIFSWQKIDGATDYHLQLATPAFTNAAQIVLDTMVTNANFTQLLEVNTYEWRIKALNSAYKTRYTTNSFEVVEEP